MKIITIAFCVWLASAVIRAMRDNARERRRVEEAQRRAAEIERMRSEWREEQKRNAERTAAMIALEREQMRQREVERKQAEWNRKQEEKAERERRERMAADAKLAKEQEKLAKRVAALECKVRKLDRNITATNERIGEYYGRLDWYLLQQSGTVSSGKEFRKWQDKIENVTDQIRKAENKIADMKDAKAMAEREMEVA